MLTSGFRWIGHALPDRPQSGGRVGIVQGRACEVRIPVMASVKTGLHLFQVQCAAFAPRDDNCALKAPGLVH
jgi:hypothetical protein